MTWTGLGEAVPQAVGIAISPIPVVLLVLVLVSSRPRTGGLAFAAGWTAGVFGAAAVVFILSDGADVDTDPSAADGGNLLQVGLGLLFVALAIREWRQRPKPGLESKPPKILGAVDSMSPPKILAFGFAAAVANPANLPLAVSGGLAIAQAGTTTGQGIVVVVLFTLIACSTVMIPVGAFLLLGDRTHAPLNALKTWLLANNSTIMIILFTVLAVVMLGSGLDLFN